MALNNVNAVCIVIYLVLINIGYHKIPMNKFNCVYKVIYLVLYDADLGINHILFTLIHITNIYMYNNC